MKKIKSFALVLLSGILISSGIAFAAPTSIQAFLQPDFRIKFNNEFKYHPEGLQPIVYQNRTYLPAAFIAEQLGATVEFDSPNKVVSIDSRVNIDQDYIKQIEEYKTKISDLEEKIKELEDNSSSSNFVRFPIRKTQNGYTLNIQGFSTVNDSDGKLYLSLENQQSDLGTKLVPLSTTISINGKEYKAATQTFTNSIDMDFFKWLEKGDTIDSFIPFSNLPDEDDINEMIVSVVVETNKYNPQVDTLVFNILND